MRNRHGFALIELPVVLFLFGLVGLVVAWVVTLFPEPLPWYGWLTAFTIPLGFFVLLALVCGPNSKDGFTDTPESNQQNQLPERSDPDGHNTANSER